MVRISELINKLPNSQKNFLKDFIRFFLPFGYNRNNLELLAWKHGTDKREHGYMEFYKSHFSSLRRKKLNILEIGVGGRDDPKSGGASLRMWQEYFSNSLIYGIDIFDKSSLEDKRMKIFQGNQNEPAFLKKVAAQVGPLHIIIDDGSHINEHVITSFQTLFPYLQNGGIYVIEDTQTSYLPRKGGNWKNLNDLATMMATFKSLVDGLNYQYIPNRVPNYFDQNIVSIHFYPKIIFIYKGTNETLLSNYYIEEMETAKTGN